MAKAPAQETNDQSNIWRRHRVLDVFLPGVNGPTASSRGEKLFKDFCDNVLRLSAKNNSRRIFLIAGPRGGGKGVLFSHLCSNGNAISQDMTGYHGQFLANFSFSNEVASVWDGLNAFLQDPNKETWRTKPSEVAWENQRKPIDSRLGLLRKALNNLQKSGGDKKRYLVAFHAFDLLFESDGYPKNAEIRAILDILFGTSAKGAPLDIVITVSDNHFPLYFRLPKDRDPPNPKLKLCPGREVNLLHEEKEIRTTTGTFEHIDAFLRKTDVKVRDKALGNIFGEGCVQSSKEDTGVYLWLLPRDHLDECGERYFFHILRTLVEERYSKSNNKLRIQNIKRIDDPFNFFVELFEFWFENDFDVQHIKEASPVEIGHLDDDIIEVGKDPVLHEMIIRHLAIISIPIEPEVLYFCPEIRDRLSALLGGLESVKALEILKCSLEILRARLLVFRVTREETKDENPRYTIHRSVQSFVYQKLGSNNTDPARSYYFSVSLYTSQTRELPSMNSNAYSFIDQLVKGLLAYPQFPASPLKSEGFGACKSRRIQVDGYRLRAACGILRTLFSIGVIARFADFDGLSQPRPPKSGFYEMHRMQLGWLLKSAARLDEEAGEEDCLKFKRPLYRDEILWLLNEIGVFSLAQGHIFDAQRMTKLAVDTVRHIEGPNGGPITNRLTLNHCIAMIDGGNPKDARKLLKNIINNTNEDETIRMIAQGYLGQTSHLAGFIDDALKYYGEAIDSLEKLGRSRPASMFRRCRGELYRHLRQFDKSENDFNIAVDLARRVGYEDMAHIALVARARMMIARGNHEDFEEVVSAITRAENYADIMEMPYLKAESSFVHAKLLLRQNETAAAGSRAIRALRIANLNGLILRSASYRAFMIDVFEARGWRSIAKQQKQNVYRSAKHCGYALLTMGTGDHK